MNSSFLYSVVRTKHNIMQLTSNIIYLLIAMHMELNPYQNTYYMLTSVARVKTRKSIKRSRLNARCFPATERTGTSNTEIF